MYEMPARTADTPPVEPGKQRVLIFGDAVLDIDVHLETIRPNGPEGVPVLRQVSRQERPGGAAAVALMAVALGAETLLITRFDRKDGPELLTMMSRGLTSRGVRLSYIEWRQPAKKRIFVDGQQLHRIDQERVEELHSGDAENLIQQAGSFAPDVILVADYGKGLVTRYLIERLLERYPAVPILVDPARGADWTMYRGAAAIVPNLEEWTQDGRDLPQCVRIQKHGSSGLSVCAFGKAMPWCDIDVPAHPINCIDVCGAGDQVLATLGVMIAEGHDWISAARLANLAAALKCERVGATPVPRKELEDAATRLGIPVSASREMAAS